MPDSHDVASTTPAASTPGAGAPARTAPAERRAPGAEAELTKAEVEAQLKGTEASINDHVDALEREVTTLGDTIKDAVLNNPLIGVGGALLAGLVVGWLVGGGRRRTEAPKQAAVQALVNSYMDLIEERARIAREQGDDPERAVRRALEDNVPLVTVADTSSESSGRSFWGIALQTISRVLLAEGVALLATKLQPSGGSAAGSREAPSPRTEEETIGVPPEAL